MASSGSSTVASTTTQQQPLGENGDGSSHSNVTTAGGSSSRLSWNAKFTTATKALASERQFRAQTVGLVTAEEYQKATSATTTGGLGPHDDENNNDNNNDKEENNRAAAAHKKATDKQERKRKRQQLKAKKKALAKLSFAMDDDDEEGADQQEQQPTACGHNDDDNNNNQPRPTSKFGKDPTVDTSALPDADREEDDRAARRHWQQTWLAQQAAVQQQPLEITYSYWDGSGHRRTLQCRKGDTVGRFVELARQALVKEFPRSALLEASDLMYVKEDVILPHDLTFYDLIATQARGKSGPLFCFDVHDDVRVGPTDVRVERDDSHPGKLVERSWYERNKHIFPASRWEVYDPQKEYETYTIKGHIVQPSKKRK